MSELMVLDRTGDTRLQWSRKNVDEVAAARKRFDEYKAKGYLAYKVNKAGDQGEVLQAFDPDAERVILAPQSIGG